MQYAFISNQLLSATGAGSPRSHRSPLSCHARCSAALLSPPGPPAAARGGAARGEARTAPAGRTPRRGALTPPSRRPLLLHAEASAPRAARPRPLRPAARRRAGPRTGSAGRSRRPPLTPAAPRPAGAEGEPPAPGSRRDGAQGEPRRRSQVDGPLQRQRLSLLDVLVAELVHAAGPAGLRAVGRHHGHGGRREAALRARRREPRPPLTTAAPEPPAPLPPPGEEPRRLSLELGGRAPPTPSP